MIVIKRVDGAIRGMVWLLRCRHRIVSEARRAAPIGLTTREWREGLESRRPRAC
jgi:hypothetical protein